MLRYFVKYKDSLVTEAKVILDSYEVVPSDYQEITKQEFEDVVASLSDLNTAKYNAKELIDRKAGEVRTRFITAVPGQAETYIMKANEARELKDQGYIVNQDSFGTTYPMISGEMSATGQDLVTTCETILAIEMMWKAVAAAIEKERRQANISIENCQTFDDIRYAIESGINSLEEFK